MNTSLMLNKGVHTFSLNFAKYLKKLFSGLQLFLHILGLSVISLVLGFLLGTIIFDEPFIDVVRADGFFDTTFFEVYSLTTSYIFFFKLEE